MTLNEALKCADAAAINQWPRASEDAAIVLAAEVRRLQAECERLPARRAQPTAKTAPIAPTNWQFWMNETDEEFAERAGRKVDGVVG